MALPRAARGRQTLAWGSVSRLSCGSSAVSRGVTRWVCRSVQVVPPLHLPLRCLLTPTPHPSRTERGCMVHRSTMLRTRSQRRATVKSGWADLPDELVEKVLAKVLEVLGGWAGGRLGVLSGLRHGAAGVRWVEGRARCAGDSSGADTADHRRGHGHAGAAVPGGGSRRWCWWR
jgi:hypothetical protein